MSRNMLCGLTAGSLAILSLGTTMIRYQVLGDEIHMPMGPDTWKITLTVQGHALPDAQVLIATPLDIHRQHLLRENYRSHQFTVQVPESRNPRKRRVVWKLSPEASEGSFKLHAEFYCLINTPHPTQAMIQASKALHAPPPPGSHLDLEPRKDADHQELAALAHRLTLGKESVTEQAQALHHFVDTQIASEPDLENSSRVSCPVDCLREESGNAHDKAVLLVALLRHRGIASRLVVGLPLTKGPRQLAHYWVEAWLQDRWVSMCPFFHHFGRVPSSFLILGFGDFTLVPGKKVRELTHAFLIERYKPDADPDADDSALRCFFRSISLYMLPPAEQRLVEFLLLLPLAAVIVCVFRNVIGLTSFGTFAPALVGLAFRDLHSLPGVGVFLAILLFGWLLRRALDHYHLLQVPRISLMLSLIVGLLVALIVIANNYEMPATRYISLFPLVILTGMIERFWTLETEDGAASSFKALLSTMVIAGTVAVLLRWPIVAMHLFRFPETLALIMAVQLLIGRYTGYRLTELFRFRDFLTVAVPNT